MGKNEVTQESSDTGISAEMGFGNTLRRDERSEEEKKEESINTIFDSTKCTENMVSIERIKNSPIRYNKLDEAYKKFLRPLRKAL